MVIGDSPALTAAAAAPDPHEPPDATDEAQPTRAFSPTLSRYWPGALANAGTGPIWLKANVVAAAIALAFNICPRLPPDRPVTTAVLTAAARTTLPPLAMVTATLIAICRIERMISLWAKKLVTLFQAPETALPTAFQKQPRKQRPDGSVKVSGSLPT